MGGNGENWCEKWGSEIESLDVSFGLRFESLTMVVIDRLDCSLKIWVLPGVESSELFIEIIVKTSDMQLIGRVRTLSKAMAWWLDVCGWLALCVRYVVALVF